MLPSASIDYLLYYVLKYYERKWVMRLKKRSESVELLTMRSLNVRMSLSNKEKFQYLNLEKGYEGEIMFDFMLEDLQEERYILEDLLFEINGSYFQIDTLVITQGVIYLLDIKNYQENCYFDSDKLYAVDTGQEYKNPLDQLKRSTTLFRQLLQKTNQNYLIEPYLIFINPEFTLYQVPPNLPIILPTQVPQFVKDLNNTPSIVNEGHKKLAQLLISLHKTKNPFAFIPKYEYKHLRKGVYCKVCKSFEIKKKNLDFVCGKCGEHERIELAILRNTKEMILLFPDKKITTQSIFEWCNVDINKKTIRRVLKKHFTAKGTTSDTYFE